MGFDVDIRYRPRIENKAADALSRVPPLVELANLTFPLVLDIQLAIDKVEADPVLSKIKGDVQEDPNSHPRYSLKHNRLLYKR